MTGSMSAFGPKRTCQSHSAMSAFGGEADITILARNRLYRENGVIVARRRTPDGE